MPRDARRLAFASLLCAAALVPLVVAAYWVGPFEHADLSLLLHVRLQESGRAQGLAEGFLRLGDLGPTLVLLSAIVGFGLKRGRRREAYAAVAVVAGANITTQVLKVLLQHPRGAGAGAIDLPWSTAFPSGHTTAAAALAAALIVVAPPGRQLVAATIGAPVALAVGATTVLASWHYPSDVVGGVLVVAAWAFAAAAVLQLDTRSRDAPSGRHRSAPPRRRRSRLAPAAE